MRFIHMHQTDSTNDHLQRLVKNGEILPGSFVSADFQTKGRGQRGSSWQGEAGKNIYMSYYYCPDIRISRPFFLSQCVSIALVRWLRRFYPSAMAKWPNDLYAGERKLGGILIETAYQNDYMKYAVIGMGINILQMDFSPGTGNPVSLCQLSENLPRLTELRMDLAEHIQGELSALERKTPGEVRAAYLGILKNFDEYALYRDRKGEFSAKITGVLGDGQLELETEKGLRRVYGFKEVEWVA